MDFFYEHRINGITQFKKNPTFAAHLHSDIEMIYISKGKCAAYINGERFDAQSGDFIIVFPNVIHQYLCSDDTVGWIAIADRNIIKEYGELLTDRIPENPIVRLPNKRTEKLFGMLFDEEYGEFVDEVRKGILLSVTGILFSYMQFKTISHDNSSIVQTVLDYCSENYRENITISDVATKLHINSSYISHLFGDKLKISFRDYINSMRISDSQAMLKNSELSVTEIAEKAGFESVRTFNRAFLKYTGKSPREFKKGIKR